MQWFSAVVIATVCNGFQPTVVLYGLIARFVLWFFAVFLLQFVLVFNLLCSAIGFCYVLI